MKEVFLYVIPFVLIQTISGQVPRILFSPTIENKKLGLQLKEFKTIRCYVDPASSDQEFKWFGPNNDEITTMSSRNTVFIRPSKGGGVELTFNKVTEDDSGEYKCQATVNGEKLKDESFHMEILAGIEIIDADCPQEQNALLGSDYHLKCLAVAGGQDLTVTWEKSYLPVDIAAQPNKYRSDAKSLIILNVTRADEAVYTYNAKLNNGATKLVDITLTVVEMPTFQVPITGQEPVVGQKAELFCTAKSKPPPTKLEWKKEGSALPITGTDRIVVSDGVSTEDSRQTILTIKKVNREDKGKYICTVFGVVVDNKKLTNQTAIVLDVQIPPTVEIEKPVPTGMEGRALEMKCIVTGSQKSLSVVWQFNNEQYGEGADTNNNIIVTKTSEILPSGDKKVTAVLRFKSVTSEEAGTYKCAASNTAGNASDSTKFDVKYSPKFIDPKEKYYTWKSQNASQETKTAIECVVKSNPAPSFQWLRDGKPITDDMPFYGISDKFPAPDDTDDHMSRSTLTVTFNGQNREVIAMYTCRAANHVAGNKEIQMDLGEAEKPNEPTVHIGTKTATEFNFNIEVNDKAGPKVNLFKVVYKKTESPEQSQTLEVARETRPIIDQERQYTLMKVQGLEESTKYAFTFFSMSPVGQSNGHEMTLITPIMRKPDVVTILTGPQAQDSTYINLRWTKPIDGGSPINYYVITKQEVIIKEGKQDSASLTDKDVVREEAVITVSDKVAPHETSFTIKGLIPDRYYRITITAHNKIGGGPPGKKIIQTREESTGDGLSTGAIVGIVIGIFLILLIIVDLTCYHKNSCGILMSIKEKVTGSRGDEGYSAAKTDDVENLAKKDELTEEAKAAEEVEVAEEEKKEPLLSSEEQKVDTIDEGETKPEKEMEPEEKEAAPKPEETKTEETPAPETKEEAPPATEEKPPAENQTPEKPAE